MKRLAIVVAVGALLLFWNEPAKAVDGYKQFKFGMSEEEVRATKACGFSLAPRRGLLEDLSSGVRALVCPDFTFGGQERTASFFFIGGDLLRITITLGMVTWDDTNSILDQLTEKYGAPRRRPTRKEFNNVGSLLFGRDIAVRFDGATVLLGIRYLMMKQLAIMIYTSPHYFPEMRKAKAEALRKDL